MMIYNNYYYYYYMIPGEGSCTFGVTFGPYQVWEGREREGMS